jgi:hypothetical protein
MKSGPFLIALTLALQSATRLLAQSAPAESWTTERFIALLRASDSVLAPEPGVHPIHIMANREATVPPQCYTRTEARYNPCYVCHQDAIEGRENVMNDGDLQEAYSFSDLGMTNQWKNLFHDRSDRVAAVADERILRYIAEDNYSELPGRLRAANFEGWIPDLRDLHLGAAAFDEHGFARDGSGWVTFNYKPFPSTFWPANGSTDDIMIRLAKPFRTDAATNEVPDIYRANLAILEAHIKGLSRITCLPLDEAKAGRDLNGDGQLAPIREITDVSSWVGAAAGSIMDTHLYPAGTEFLHTVRYIGIGPDDAISPATRMKEVRYMRKARAYSKPVYARQYQLESFDKEAGNLPGYAEIGQHGLDNGNGWAVQGFIEDRRGRLRTLTHEENFACMGCHNSVGSTIDKTFGFPRKVDGAAGWGYINLKGMPDAPSRGDTRGEIATYLARAGGGSEFRNNDEMVKRWFRPDGSVDPVKLAQARDVYDLITPSRERALALNKAYLTLVEDQAYIFGKDPVIIPPVNVYDKIDNEKSPTLPPERIHRYNILLDWPASAAR